MDRADNLFMSQIVWFKIWEFKDYKNEKEKKKRIQMKNEQKRAGLKPRLVPNDLATQTAWGE